MIKRYVGIVPLMIETDDITKLPADVLDDLDVGDVVVKRTGAQKHLYVVNYKGEGVGEGICMCYSATGYSETHSYDFTENGWAYNSKDVWLAQ